MIGKNLEQKDIEIFYTIYQNRCLTFQQLYKYYFNNSSFSFEEFINNYINNWVLEGYIELIQYKPRFYAVFLTNKAIGLLKNNKLDSIVFDKKSHVITRGYYTAKDIKIQNRSISHQINLVEFFLKVKASINDSNLCCYDEKQMSKYTMIRPDGLITYHNIDYFVEIDMCTESIHQLQDKIKRYSLFFHQNQYYKNQKIIVLFIFKKHIESRINSVKKLVADEFSFFQNITFDFLFGDIDEIIEKMKLAEMFVDKTCINKIFSTLYSQGYSILKSNEAIKYFNNAYDAFIILSKKIATKQNGNPIEFVIGIEYGTLGLWNKILCHSNNTKNYLTFKKREIPAIFIVKDKKEVISDIQYFNLASVKNVFFSTFDDITTLPLYKAIFGVSNLGKFNFTDNAFQLIKKECE